MAGTSAKAHAVRQVLTAYSSAAVTAATLTEYVMTFKGRIVGVRADAETAGGGAGDTVLDITVNGTSIWSVAANKPTLAAASTGAFANLIPIATVRNVKAGDLVILKVASISDAGHARLSLSAAVEMA